MKEYIEKRVVEIAEYILASGDTMRGAGKHFAVSKSTVHKDISERLIEVDSTLFKKVRKVVEKNLAERHIRGGMMTKKHFEDLKKRK